MRNTIPTDAHVARSDEADQSLVHLSLTPQIWVGDVWKVACLLRACRPDLRMQGLRMPHAGLVAVTNLDPRSDVLDRRYHEMVARYASETADQARIDDFLHQLAPMDIAAFLRPATLSQLFPL